MVILDEELVEGLRAELNVFSKEEILLSVEDALKKMKASDFELIELKFYGGKSYKEIGYILGCSENSAKVRAHRVIKRLRAALTKRVSA